METLSQNNFVEGADFKRFVDFFLGLASIIMSSRCLFCLLSSSNSESVETGKNSELVMPSGCHNQNQVSFGID